MTQKWIDEGGGEAGTSQSHSRQKKGHMTNIYLTDSDEEAIVDKARKIVFGRGSPTAMSSMSRVATASLSHKGYITASSHNPSLDRPQKR